MGQQSVSHRFLSTLLLSTTSETPLFPHLSQTSPVTTGLVDRHPYVRRTAVMGVLKIYHIDPNMVLAQGAHAALTS